MSVAIPEEKNLAFFTANEWVADMMVESVPFSNTSVMRRGMTLIITHDKKFAQQVERVLSTKGQAVILAFTGQDGLSCAQELSPELIVLDMYLKDPAGSEVLHALREQGFRGKIILLAGLSVSPLVPDALRFGIERVLAEPLGLEPLECAIRSALGSSQSEGGN